MIKINLLRTKKTTTGPKMKKEFVVLIGALVLLLVVLGAIHWRMSRAIEMTSAKIASTKKEIASYEAQIAQARKAEEAQKILHAQLEIINTLRKEKSGAARILDEVSTRKPEKLHLEGMKKDGAKLMIEGIALDDETIANFMTNLRMSKLFKNVDLVVSETTEQSKVKLKKFTLACELQLT